MTLVAEYNLSSGRDDTIEYTGFPKRLLQLILRFKYYCLKTNQVIGIVL